MTFNKGLWASGIGEHATPWEFFEYFDFQLEGIPLDVCAVDGNAKCPVWLTPFDDALSLDWRWVLEEVIGTDKLIAWMNPPYGRVIKYWVKKAWEESRQGVTVVSLLPARTDTKWWHQYVMKASELYLVEGRLKFSGSRNSAPFPSAVAIFTGYSSDPALMSIDVRGMK